MPAAERDNHFFATVDFDQAMSIFQQVWKPLRATLLIGAYLYIDVRSWACNPRRSSKYGPLRTVPAARQTGGRIPLPSTSLSE